MLRPVLIRLSQESRLRTLASHNPVLRSMARRFVAGETLEEAIDVVRATNARDMTVTLDHLGENVQTAAQARAAAEDYCGMLAEITRAGVTSNVSLKLTQLGLDLGDDVAYENLRRVVDVAAQDDNFVRIDMENSEYVDRTLAIFYRLFETHRNLGVVIQSYLYRSEADVARLIEAGARVRLVKGAYLEPATVAYQDKADVDRNFVVLMEMLLARGNYPAIATHDPAMIDATRNFAAQQGIEASRYEFQMLYGIRRDLQTELVRAGYNVRIYVPFGTEWYPYLMRRMAERPANLMFVLGNVAREALPSR
ncbi:MAG TPA: proline dehydrogenase family protein [Chloroflexota bacterium]|nr:proline dehydrogenase family protein [Chloroflexota bacterium]